MLTRRSNGKLSYLLVLLISLTLVALVPLTDAGCVNAAETEEMVDITSKDVNQNEGKNEEISDETASEEEDEIYFEGDSEEKTEKKSKENEDIYEDGVIFEDEESGDEADSTSDSGEIIDEAGDEDADADTDGDADTDPQEGISDDDELLQACDIEDDEEVTEDNNEETSVDQDEDTPDDEDGVPVDEDTDDNTDEDGDAEGAAAEEDADQTGAIEANTDLNGQFPASYQPMIEALQAEHPNWTFVPVETGLSWETVLDKEDKGSTSLISPSAPKAQKEKSNKKYDGRWSLANRATIAHYMDPRNFLNDDGIYQFLQQTYDEDSQNVDTVAAVIEGSFMDGKCPGGDFETFQACIDDAGEEAGVNANVLAAMIIEEQGWEGSKMVSGKNGYYNFFNIGAWTTKDMSSTERGLWYAKGSGEGATSYERPWDSAYKAILGGAEFYYENYVGQNQDTFYTKKFNVMNGADSVGKHQYMTNVQGAADEGKLLSRAYDNSDVSATFAIPVYQNMPQDACELPQ